jgi:hypothetical protein
MAERASHIIALYVALGLNHCATAKVHPVPNTIRVMKSKTMLWMRHVARMR